MEWENKVLHGDCSEWMKKIEDKSIDLLLTDPPYLHVKGGMKSKKYNVGTWKSDSEMVTNYSDFGEEAIYDFLDLAIKKMKKINMYIFCSKLQLQYYLSYIRENKLKYDLLVWDKVKYSMKSSKFYTSDIEYVVRIYQNGVSLRKVLNEEGTKSDISYYLKRQAYQQPRNRRHETEKPLELIEKYIKVSTDEGDVVLDTFLGSGTTAVAAVNTNRNFIGIEKSWGYCEIANNRITEAIEQKREHNEKDVITND